MCAHRFATSGETNVLVISTLPIRAVSQQSTKTLAAGTWEISGWARLMAIR
jgi:hypothetical protein